VETYAVLTRLPGSSRLAPADAARLIRERFVPPLLLSAKASRRIADVLSELGIAGGAVYDALVALAAVEHDADLATRDLRAKATYDAVGARVVIAS
jgi:toxin FitB